jgi:hypothetical protein
MRLQKLEARLRSLIESRLIRALQGQKPEDVLVQRLTEVMLANVHTDAAGSRSVPNVYTLIVHPQSSERWRDPATLGPLLDVLKGAAAELDLSFGAAPTMTVAEDPRVEKDEFQIVGSHSAEPLAPTQDMLADTAGQHIEEEAPSGPENAFLIVQGVKEYALNSPVVNIGRRLDNNLVVDDPRVSRHHAQLRAIKGRYVLFDLDSSGGTFVNGQRTSQTVLYPGDVVSLAGVALVFGQDSPLPRGDRGETGPGSHIGGERPTAIFRSTSASGKSR